jgi:hypothetical protein
MAQEIERMDVVRRQLQPEHRDQLRELRRKIDGLLDEEAPGLTTS